MVNFRNLTGKAGDIAAKAKKYVDDNPDKVGAGLDKVGDLVDKGTKGRFTEQIRQGRDLAKDKVVRPRTEAERVAHLDDDVRPTTGEDPRLEVQDPERDVDGRAPGRLP